jgi:hypothetical protein
MEHAKRDIKIGEEDMSLVGISKYTGKKPPRSVQM